MKTYRETGDPGYRAVILKHFCSTVSFWKLETFITPLLRRAYAVRRYFLRWGCVIAKTRLAS